MDILIEIVRKINITNSFSLFCSVKPPLMSMLHNSYFIANTKISSSTGKSNFESRDVTVAAFLHTTRRVGFLQTMLYLFNTRWQISSDPASISLTQNFTPHRVYAPTSSGCLPGFILFRIGQLLSHTHLFFSSVTSINFVCCSFSSFKTRMSHFNETT